MKYCSNCGTPADDSAGFCPSCGTPFSQPAPSNNVQPGPQQGYAQQPYAQQGYAQPYAQQPQIINNVYTTNPPHAGSLKTNRGLLKLILLSMITFGIYGLVVMSGVSTDINIIASRYDGKKTMHYCLLFFIVGPITLGIADLVWSHRISERIGNELRRRGIQYSFGAADFWIWGIVGSLIIVGPFVYTHKLLKSMNLLSENYNMFG